MDGLRLALIIFGIVVVAVVYFWTARRRRLDREAGDFDRFDAWTDDALDPLEQPVRTSSSDADAFDGPRHVADPLMDDDIDEAVVDADDLTQPNLRMPAVQRSLEFDTPHEAGAESIGATTSRQQAGTPANGALGGGEVIEDLEAIVDSLDVRAEPSIGALDDIDLQASPPSPTPSMKSGTTGTRAPRVSEQSSGRGSGGGPGVRSSGQVAGQAPGRSHVPARGQSDEQASIGAQRNTEGTHQVGGHSAGRSGAKVGEPHESNADAEMVVVLNVMARGGQTFDGSALKDALDSAGLKPGDMQLYHYRSETQSGDSPPVFSALNVVKPGTLDVNEFEGMRTPGIALILRMPGLERPSESFELMLVAARRIAEKLDGQVCDDTRSTLTGQALNHLRERIAAVAFRGRTGA